MVPISIEEFIKKIKKENMDIKETRESILAAAERKEQGAKCIVCGQKIWAIGSGITGSDMCFTCTTGESDPSEDYELDTVCD